MGSTRVVAQPAARPPRFRGRGRLAAGGGATPSGHPGHYHEGRGPLCQRPRFSSAAVHPCRPPQVSLQRGTLCRHAHGVGILPQVEAALRGVLGGNPPRGPNDHLPETHRARPPSSHGDGLRPPAVRHPPTDPPGARGRSRTRHLCTSEPGGVSRSTAATLEAGRGDHETRSADRGGPRADPA